jgi:hypothetical protein
MTLLSDVAAVVGIKTSLKLCAKLVRKKQNYTDNPRWLFKIE